MGTHGVLNQQPEPPVAQGGTYTPQTPNPVPANPPTAAPVYHEPQIGEIVSQLPDNCEVVYLNSQKYYESPAKVFYQELISNGRTSYKVVGK